MYRVVIFIYIAILVLVAGCRPPQVAKNAFKDVRSYYHVYLNTPAKLDLENKGNCEEYELALAAAVSGFDFQLRELERVLQNSDRSPDAAWVGNITKRFPWLAGVALADDTGEARAKIPVDYPKPFEVTALTKVDAKQYIKDLRAFVQTDPLGPEIYIGNPVYLGSEFKGIVVVHFDPRTLIARTADPGKFMIASPQGILWPGLYDSAATPMVGVKWDEVVKDSSYGTISNDTGTFYWMARYVGNLPLIYAIRVKGEFPQNINNLSALAAANDYALGAINIPGADSPAAPPRAPKTPEVPTLLPYTDDGYRPPRPQTDAASGIEGDLGDIGNPNVAPDALPAGPVVPQPQMPEAKTLQK